MSSKFRRYTNNIVITSVSASLALARKHHPHIDVIFPVSPLDALYGAQAMYAGSSTSTSTSTRGW